MDNIALEGNCLCGKVTVNASEAKPVMGACHCSMCRRWGGGPLFAVDCGQAVHFSGEDNISRYASSEWAERGFCNQCGTHLFYHMKGNDQYIMPAGLFEGMPSLEFDHQIFIDEKPDNYDFANKTHNMTGAEVFASFAPETSD